MWQRVFLYLKSKGIEIYSPGQKTGPCEKPYVVLKDGGTYNRAGTNKVGYSLLDVIIFCPINQYSKIEGYKKQIKEHLKEFGMRAAGTETPIVIDEDKKAYTTSIGYQIHKKL